MLTLFHVAAGVRLLGPPVDGVAALLVLSGTMSLEVGGEPARTVAAGNLALIPAGCAAKLASACSPIVTTVKGRSSLVPRDGWLVADATRRRDPGLIVAAGRIHGSAGVGGIDTVLVPIATDPIGRPMFAQLRAECERGPHGLPALAATVRYWLSFAGHSIQASSIGRLSASALSWTGSSNATSDCPKNSVTTCRKPSSSARKSSRQSRSWSWWIEAGNAPTLET